jgi:exopolysaccharide/PEP-CTERM locus tyrosine autokinase
VEPSTVPKSSSDSNVEKIVNRVESSEILDKSVKGVTSPKARTHIPIEKSASGIETNGKWDTRLSNAVSNDSALPEVFRTLRSKILHPLDGTQIPRSILVTSAIPREGKSFVTANLGISIANGMDQHCLLVDCDLRQPTLAQSLGVNQNYGLVDYLRDQVNLAELITKTSVQKLSILPSGSAPSNPAELLSSSRIQGFTDEVSNRYEDRIIIFDSPPVLLAAESLVLASQVDAIVLVIRQGQAKRAQIQKTVDIVDKDKILGIVFNDYTPNYLDETATAKYGNYGY